MYNKVIELIPGVAFLFSAGLLGWFIGTKVPYLSYLIICIGIGLLISNTIGLPDFVEKGIYNTHKIWLEAGIVVLGARILLGELLMLGPVLSSLVLLFLVIGLLLTQFMASRFGLSHKLGSCLASGLSVCGVSAIIATGGGISAKRKHIAYAIAVVLAFDVVTVFSYPLVGELFSIPSRIFGGWAGLSMFSTGTTVAAGFAYSEIAGETATMVKMARNVFIGIWALLFSLYYARKGLTSEISSKTDYLWDKFPKFVLGFIFIMILANIGFLTEAQIEYMKNAYSWLFMMAFVGLGYDIDIRDMRKMGLKPVLVTITAFLVISSLSLVSLYIVLF